METPVNMRTAYPKAMAGVMAPAAAGTAAVTAQDAAMMPRIPKRFS
jgi:hypothetical protein